MRLTAALALAASMLSSRVVLAVQGGAEDRNTTFSVSIVEGGPAAPRMHCSGTLVSPNVVLTVRHCVTSGNVVALDRCDQELGSDERALWVGASPWVSLDVGLLKVTSVVLPEPKRLCGNDVALLILEKPFSEAQASPARVVTRADEFRALAKPRFFGLTGFGAVDVGGTGSGVRRSRRDVPIGCVPGEPGYECREELDYMDPREFTGRSGACSGDSGGGAIASTDEALVFGVLSRGKLGETCADGVFERTDVWSYLIARTVIDAAPATGKPAPEWAASLFPGAPREDQFCRDTPACGDGHECASIDGQRSWVCLATCSSAKPCAAGRHCESGLCVSGVAPRESSDGCAIGGRSSSTISVCFLALVASLARRARRRR